MWVVTFCLDLWYRLCLIRAGTFRGTRAAHSGQLIDTSTISDILCFSGIVQRKWSLTKIYFMFTVSIPFICFPLNILRTKQNEQTDDRKRERKKQQINQKLKKGNGIRSPFCNWWPLYVLAGLLKDALYVVLLSNDFAQQV